MDDDTIIPINGAQQSQPPPDDPPPVVLLGDRYAKAILGCTISMTEQSRACYSLPLLEECERTSGPGVVDEARDRVLRLIHAVSTQHGSRAPVFVDDTLTRKEKPRIVRPGGWRPGGGPPPSRRR